ncbi:MAG: MMPL family transporter [Polyangiaceae bacterium]|jgi:predicted exporter
MPAAFALVTLICTWLTVAKLRVSTDLSALFPDSGEAAALARWTRAFGGRDPALLLVRGDRPADVEGVAKALAEVLKHAPSIDHVVDRVPEPDLPVDPTLAWSWAGPTARARLADAISPGGMRRRLADTRALLLAPAQDAQAEAWLARDPLRLSQIPWESRTELAGGVGALPGSAFTADGGRVRLVVAQPRGNAFDSDDAKRTVDDIERAVASSTRPGVRVELAGGHAIARATEEMLKRDLAVSGTLSLVLASIAFVATFRRARALGAVLPPLIVGTLWTTGLAALFPDGVSAVAVAFAAVVVGVGVDTGVHVYAALLDARRAGYRGRAAIRRTRAATAGPTLTAALVAALAFASLGLSGLRAMQQLGILCGAGELLTAIAIVVITPELGAWLERGPPPAARDSVWVGWIARATATRRRSIGALVGAAVPLFVLAIVGWPPAADALVAVRPRSMLPLRAEADVQTFFGGHTGQWFVLEVDAAADSARARADRVAERLEMLRSIGDIEGFDALATFAPAGPTQRARLAERDALDLPEHVDALRSALVDVGFSVKACAAALDAFAHPSAPPPPSSEPSADLSFLFARHLGRDGRETVVVTYVRPTGDAARDERAHAAILAADPRAEVTSFDAIDRSLREAMHRDIWVVSGVSLGVVAVAMRLALKSARHALVAIATLACEMGAVGAAMRLIGIRWHVYDALVLPVLFGVTIDESMFLLHSARAQPMADALRDQGPLVAATALTTAAGFAALLACRFDGLRDLGAVGAIGVIAGLVAALVVVPAAVRVVKG